MKQKLKKLKTNSNSIINVTLIIVLIVITIILSVELGKFLAIRNNQQRFEKKLITSMELTGKWFINNQTGRGDFYYQRDVKTGRVAGGYNIVRQAGSLYSLAQLYKYNHDPQIKEILENGFAFFQNNLESHDENADQLCVVYEDIKKSNSSALLLLALIEYMEADPAAKEKYLTTAEKIANYLMATQLENGGFIYKFEPEEIESDYNNGETFYALIRMYRLHPKEEYLSAVKKASDYFLVKYGEADKLNYSFFAWSLAGYAHLYQIEAKEEYYEFIKNYTDQYFDQRANNIIDYFNDQNENHPSANLGVFLEGLAHSAWIIKEKNPEYYQQIKNFIEESLKYLMTLQINGPNSTRTSNYKEVRYGFCNDHNCSFLRIDLVHHNLSAIYLYLTYVK